MRQLKVFLFREAVENPLSVQRVFISAYHIQDTFIKVENSIEWNGIFLLMDLLYSMLPWKAWVCWVKEL